MNIKLLKLKAREIALIALAIVALGIATIRSTQANPLVDTVETTVVEQNETDHAEGAAHGNEAREDESIY